MSTGTETVQKALQKIGAHSALAPAPTESLIDGFDIMTSMLEEWLSEGIKLGTIPTEVIADDINEPPDAREAIRTNLAIRLAPDFGNGKETVSPQLQRTASILYNKIKRLYRSTTIPGKVVSSNLPVGQGNNRNWGYGYYGQTYFQEGDTIDN